METPLTINVPMYGEIEGITAKICFNEKFTFHVTSNWTAASNDTFKKFFNNKDIEILWCTESNLGTQRILYKTIKNPVLVDVRVDTKAIVNATISSQVSLSDCHKYITKLQSLLTVANDPAETDIAVDFWYMASNGPQSIQRRIVAPKWDEIEYNYPPDTQEGLNKLFNEFSPTKGGQLILFHGLPGAGKTFSLRALCQAWKKWCKINYILDPEQLFGGNTSYFANLIIDKDETYYDPEGEEYEVDTTVKQWRLLILEDTGELLSEDAHSATGQGLSRLLNVVDGFIGQGLRVLVLITTNEDIGKLHPAVSREGRCAAAIEFRAFSHHEAKTWAKRNKVTLPSDNKSYSLAELYAIAKNNGQIRVDVELEKSFGFKAPK